MIVSDSCKFIFVHVPKTAGTSMWSALEPFADGQSATHGNTAHETLPAFMARHPERKTHFKFAFVRNPWERLVSLFFHAKQKLAPTYPQFQALDDVETMLRVLDRGEDWLRQMPGIRAQGDYVHGENRELLADFVGRYETLPADFTTACKRAGISPSLPTKNTSSHGHYSSYYNKWCRDFVAAQYANDIREFDYTFEAA